MTSDKRFGDEPSMAEILASVRKIVAEDVGSEAYKQPKSESAEPQAHSTDEHDETSNRSDILQRLLRKQADLDTSSTAEEAQSEAPVLVANPDTALGVAILAQAQPHTKSEPTLRRQEQPQLDSDEIEILDLTNPIRTSTEEAVPTPTANSQAEHSEVSAAKVMATDDSKPASLDLDAAFQKWAEGAGNPILRKLIREEIAAVFKNTFKD